MNLHAVFIFIILAVNILFGQEKLFPPKTEINNLILDEFITGLKSAVKNKDKEFIINILAPDILNSFGGNGGIEEFKNSWDLSSDGDFWKLMEKLLRLGGGKPQGDDFYTIPYVFSYWPEDEKYDPFQYMAITGARVNVRNKPNLKNSKVVGQFSYDIVKVDYEKSVIPFNETTWYYTESVDGNLKGFVSEDYIWSPIGYRANFEFIDDEWKMTVLVSGD